jgi:hypothetical protein
MSDVLRACRSNTDRAGGVRLASREARRCSANSQRLAHARLDAGVVLDDANTLESFKRGGKR